MKELLYLLITIGTYVIPSSATILIQTFETGEDTLNWGSDWNNGSISGSFLEPSLGGSFAGSGESNGQSFWREFRNNSAGIDITLPYTASMYVQLNAFDGPTGGQFEIIDGAFGSANTANLRIDTRSLSPGVFSYYWQAKDNGSWQDIGVEFELATAYRVDLAIDPTSFTYSAFVAQITPSGTMLNSGSLVDLGFDPNVITNHQNGELRFFVQSSAGGTVALVDNINIEGVPEPSVIMLAAMTTLFTLRRRRPNYKTHSNSGLCRLPSS